MPSGRLGRQAQLGQAEVGPVRVLADEERVVRLAQEAGRLAGRDAAVADHVRERDERRDRRVVRPAGAGRPCCRRPGRAPGCRGAGCRRAAGRGRSGCSSRPSCGSSSGGGPTGPGRTGRAPSRTGAGARSGAGPGVSDGDRLELAADAVGGVGLHVERVDVRRPAALVQEDDVLGPRPRGRAAPRRPAAGSAGSGPANPAAPDLEQAPPRERGSSPEVGAAADSSVRSSFAIRSAVDRRQCRSRNSLLLRIAQATSSHALRRSAARATWARAPARSRVGRARGRGRRGRARRGSPRRRPPTPSSRPIRLSSASSVRADRLAVDELERLGQRGRLGPLALAGQQAVGLAEDLEEVAPRPARPATARRGRRRGASGTPRAGPAPGRSRRAGPRPAGAGPTARAKLASSSALVAFGPRAELVGLRLHDQGDQRLEPHPAARRTRSVRASSSAGFDGGLRVAEVVDRLDDAPAHQVEPDAVGQVAGELRVVAGQPVGQVVEGVGVVAAGRARAAGRLRAPSSRRCGAGPSAGWPVEVDDLVAVDLVLVEAVACGRC